jgi:photosystem II stability/assembly factor-like uncharacterized protein
MRHAILITAALVLCALAIPRAEQVNPSYFADMKWRSIGPPRSGYVSAPAGIPGDPTTYYAGMPEGGVWKTTNGGVTWKPIFDDAHVASVGAVAVAPSNPNIVYVGTGSQVIWSFTAGKGVYKSIDAGKTWMNVGLPTSRYIGGIVVDPKNPDVLLVAALGARQVPPGAAAGAPSPDTTSERGVFRSADGGRTWTRVLAADGSAGASDVFGDYRDGQITYALLTNGTAHKSTDGGMTWQAVGTRGFPEGARIAAFALASGTGGRRVYALVGTGGGRGQGNRGLYRSEDGGETWTLGTRQLASAGGKMYADPQNPDVVYIMGTAIYRSIDGGRHFAAFWGAPSGADPRYLWIDPTNPKRMFSGVDQGAAITVDGGESWTPYYGLVNGQFYRVATDYDFPYHVCGPQQDSGTACVTSRSDFGIIRPNDWYPGGGFENGFLIADPLDKRYMYTQGWYHVLRRYDRVTGQVVVLYQPSPDDRFGGAPPLAFSPKGARTLYTAAQHVLASDDRGKTWRVVSPDLAAPKGLQLPATLTAGGGSVAGPAQGGSITTLSLSPVSEAVLWAGTSTNLIHVTRDGGKNWANVTPPNLPLGTINVLDASHASAGAAYAAVLTRDSHPHIYRTTDYGSSWNEIVNGLADGAVVRAVREDPADASILYAGTVTGAWVSFDRGDGWQSLQLNLPTTVVSDVTVHGDDLVISTYGRGFWILDDLSPLRQARQAMASTAPAYLFKPAPASRARWDNTQDTPLPPEMKVGDNPPEGAIIDYYLAAPASDAITLSITDAAGALIREYTSTAPAPDTTMANVPEYWLAPPTVLKTSAGMHRVNWDLRYPDPPVLNYGYGGNLLDYREYTLSWHALPGQTPRTTLVGPMVLPGTYAATLSVNGRTYTQRFDVIPDPRVTVPPAGLASQFRLQQRMVAGIAATYQAFNFIQALRNDPAAQPIDAALNEIASGPAGLGTAHRDLARRLNDQLVGDLEPTPSITAAVDASCAAIDAALARLRDLQTKNAGIAPLAAWKAPPARGCDAPPSVRSNR